MFSALTASFSSVFFAEMGDKTQLLTLFLAAKFMQKYAIILGIIVATLLNHFVSAWLGLWLSSYFSEQILAYLVGISFILVGLWLLIPDKEEEGNTRWLKYGAFAATLILFFIAEIGDKTQIATIILAAKFESLSAVVIGSTAGLLFANIPIVFMGEKLIALIPMRTIRILACIIFCILGLISLQINF